NYGIYAPEVTDLNYFGGNVGIGTSSPAAKLHTLGTTEQLRLGYDNTRYAAFDVSSAGSLTIDNQGTFSVEKNGSVVFSVGTITGGTTGISLSTSISPEILNRAGAGA